MTRRHLEALVSRGEGAQLEFKETTGQRGEACRTLCAFLNGDGGSVVFGVSRKGRLVGQLVSDETRRDLAHAFYDFEPGADVAVEYVSVDETHQAVVCTVSRGARRPYVYDGRPYVRIESTTAKMPQPDYESLMDERRGFVCPWDVTQAGDLTMEDLDEREIRRTARMAVSAGRLEASADTEDVRDLLRKFRLTRGGRLLNAAAVLFGRDLTLYPQCHLKLAWFRGNTKMEFRDSGDVYGNVFVLFDAAMAFLFKNLRLSGVVKGLEREEGLEIPAEALREAVINALAHRLYTQSGAAVSIAIYDDRVEICNPGTFPPEMPVQTLTKGSVHDSLPRNERIAEVLYKRKTIEAWGRGMSVMVEACAQKGVSPPEFSCDGHFVRAVFRRPQGKADGAMPQAGTNVALAESQTRTSRKTSRKTDRKTSRKNAPDMATEALVDLVRSDGRLTLPEMARILGLSVAGVRYQLALLASRGRVRRAGGRKFGQWEILK